MKQARNTRSHLVWLNLMQHYNTTLDSTGSRQGPVVGLSEHSKDPLGFLKGG
jgi:hypothetical protein